MRAIHYILPQNIDFQIPLRVGIKDFISAHTFYPHRALPTRSLCSAKSTFKLEIIKGNVQIEFLCALKIMHKKKYFLQM